MPSTTTTTAASAAAKKKKRSGAKKNAEPAAQQPKPKPKATPKGKGKGAAGQRRAAAPARRLRGGAGSCDSDTSGITGRGVTLSQADPQMPLGRVHDSTSEQVPMTFQKSEVPFAPGAIMGPRVDTMVFPLNDSGLPEARGDFDLAFVMPSNANHLMVPYVMAGGARARSPARRKAAAAAPKKKKAPAAAAKSKKKKPAAPAKSKKRV